MSGLLRQGEVVWYDRDEGQGQILEDRSDEIYLVNEGHIEHGFRSYLEEGERVEFTVWPEPDQHPKYIRFVRPIINRSTR